MNILQKFILLMFRSLFMMVISYNALANDTVVVTFTGQLLAKTCDITTGSKDQPVNMGTYDVNDFLNVGDVSGSHTFTINLEGCPTTTSTVYSSGVSANVQFTGDADAINTTLLRLTSSADSATGVGIEILDSNDKIIAINSESGFKELILNNNGGETEESFYQPRFPANDVPLTRQALFKPENFFAYTDSTLKAVISALRRVEEEKHFTASFLLKYGIPLWNFTYKLTGEETCIFVPLYRLDKPHCIDAIWLLHIKGNFKPHAAWTAAFPSARRA